jgi:hypothetical protein
VKRSTGVAVPEQVQGCAEHLARFFPNARAVHIAVEVTTLRGTRLQLREVTTLEFAAADHAIFLSTLPLEFDDRVRLKRGSNGSATEATVVAVQYHDGRKAVAVRFAPGPHDWVTQP